MERLLNSGHTAVGVDCEGTRLGRFGRLSLVQLATEKEIFLLDVAVGGTALVDRLVPLLECRDLVKVFHDCREDAALLHHQYRAPLVSVFDTQVGHAVWLERRGLVPYQANVAEVLRTFQVDAYRAHRWDELERHPVSPQRWHDRPLDPKAIRYAVEGVAHLPALRRAICHELGDPNGELVLRRSVQYAEYAYLNEAELPSEDLSGLQAGAAIGAMLAARRPDAAFFKLNHSGLTGAVLDVADLREFADLTPGEVARCRIKFVSECGEFVHLQREGHGDLYFDQRSQAMRRLPQKQAVDAAQQARPSSLYGYGATGGPGRPAFREEPSSYKGPRKEGVVYKPGTRGQPKVLDGGIKPARRQREDRRPEQDRRPEHTSFGRGLNLEPGRDRGR